MVLLALVVGSALLLGTRSAFAAGVRVVSYTIDATIEASGDVLFQETIVYDFDTNARHGIYRDIVTRQRFDDRYDREYDLDVISVTSPTPRTPTEYEILDQENLSRIRIGDPDSTITGVRTYVITYRLKHILNAFDDHDELYWNMIAPLWDVPIDASTIVVHTPKPPTQVACFAGPERSAKACARATIEGNGASFAASGLRPQNAFTVVIELSKGTVAAPTIDLHERWAFERAFTVDPLRLGMLGVLAAAVIAGVWRLVWVIGRDRQWRGQSVARIPAASHDVEDAVPLFNGTVTPPEYTPPDGMRPGLVGTIVDETAHPLDVSATIVDLAVRGYLKIEEIEATGWFGSSDWQLTRLKQTEGLATYESLLLDGLFEEGNEVKFSDLRTKFATKLASMQQALYQELVDRGWYRRSPASTRGMWVGLGIAALVGAIGIFVATAAFTTFGIVPLPLILGAVVLLSLAGRMPARTANGTAMYRRVLGFRRFILDAETERSRFAERANLFYEYLPYAIVFRATKQWAKAFEDLNLPTPDWYVSSHPFTTLALVSAMGDFSDRSVSAITSTPGGSGSSGFGGGGFSGGGGGGGGGGSW